MKTALVFFATSSHFKGWWSPLVVLIQAFVWLWDKFDWGADLTKNNHKVLMKAWIFLWQCQLTHTYSGSDFPGADAKKCFPSWCHLVFLSSWSTCLQRQGTNSRGGARRSPSSSSRPVAPQAGLSVPQPPSGSGRLALRGVEREGRWSGTRDRKSRKIIWHK